MTDLFDSEALTIDDALGELRREMKMRPRVYTRLVQTGKMTVAQAERQMRALQKAILCLEKLKTIEGWENSAP